MLTISLSGVILFFWILVFLGRWGRFRKPAPDSSRMNINTRSFEVTRTEPETPPIADQLSRCLNNWLETEYYIIITFPRFAISALLAITTEIVIVGYSLQVGKIGIKAATASGQIYLPIYKLAPYRMCFLILERHVSHLPFWCLGLAVICVGLASAFIWTIFPSVLNCPTSKQASLRNEI